MAEPEPEPQAGPDPAPQSEPEAQPSPQPQPELEPEPEPERAPPEVDVRLDLSQPHPEREPEQEPEVSSPIWEHTKDVTADEALSAAVAAAAAAARPRESGGGAEAAEEAAAAATSGGRPEASAQEAAEAAHAALSEEHQLMDEAAARNLDEHGGAPDAVTHAAVSDYQQRPLSASSSYAESRTSRPGSAGSSSYTSQVRYGSTYFRQIVPSPLEISRDKNTKDHFRSAGGLVGVLDPRDHKPLNKRGSGAGTRKNRRRPPTTT